MIKIYDNILAVAKPKKVTIRSLENTAHLSVGSICKWNVVSPNVRSLKKVADALEVTVDSLLTETK